MLKRLLLIGMLCLCLIALVGTDASARCRVVGGVLKCGSVCADALLKGVGTPDILDSWVCVSLGPTLVDLYCLNKGGNSSTGEGNPFFPVDTNIAGGDSIQVSDLTDENRGTVLKEICFEDSLIFEQLSEDPNFPDAEEYCQNNNWGFDPNRILIRETWVYYATYAADGKDDDDCPDRTSELCYYCTYAPINGECNYNCVQEQNVNNCVNEGLADACYGKTCEQAEGPPPP
jgi:hypothetical protein